MGSHDDVSLYPGVKMDILDELFDLCDYYLDINHESEIVSAVYKAFLNDQLIFAFRETLHHMDYVAESHIYPAEEAGRMIADLKSAMENGAVLDAHLKRQREEAMSECAERYAVFRKQI